MNAYALFRSRLFKLPLLSSVGVTKSKLSKLAGGFDGIAAFDKLEFVLLGLVEPGFVELAFVEEGFVELLAASRVFKRFAASPANSPFGYFFKYSLKSSGFVLSLIEFQKIISAAEAASPADFAGLVREFLGVLFFGGGVVVFGVGVFFVDGNVAFGSCADVVPLIESNEDSNESRPTKRMSAEMKMLLLIKFALISDLSKPPGK